VRVCVLVAMGEASKATTHKNEEEEETKAAEESKAFAISPNARLRGALHYRGISGVSCNLAPLLCRCCCAL